MIDLPNNALEMLTQDLQNLFYHTDIGPVEMFLICPFRMAAVVRVGGRQ